MKFSVIIPVYNKADTLPRAIDSVLAQGVEAELVIVDDGSTDRIDAVLARYEGVTVVRQANGGVSAARNAGIRRSAGEYLCFLDADDEWEPDHLTTLLALMGKYPSAEYFVTGHREIRRDGTVRSSGDGLRAYPEDFLCGDLLGLLNRTSYGVIHTNSVCVKKSVLTEEGILFEPGAAIGEDTDVWYRLALRHPAAVSRRATTVYHRECSTATGRSFYTRDWVFCRREQDILADDTIESGVKRSAMEVLDRYKLESARRYALEGDRSRARETMRTVEQRSGKRYALTRIFCMLPREICRILYSLK